MATITVVRCLRRKKLGDKTSPLVNALKRKAGDAKTYDIKYLANEIESIGSLSVEDVEHVIKSLVRSMKTILCNGNRLKLDGFGTFYITFHCNATDDAKNCTVRNIDCVHVRFKVDNTLRLVNDSLATTRGAANNLVFELEKPKTTDSSDGGSSSDGGNTSGDGGNTGGSDGGVIDDNPLG
ncbi:MAG: HU family DNA-binding protein [Bacteroides sp.]|jgi:predicted histone-like DNA-binding protein|nr:HU family DNA-binding protein [Bacteroides sp.]MCI1683073.1 HU family DNA-binding protein [Bacteroides sp.]